MVSKEHIFTKREQNDRYKAQRDLEYNVILIHADYSENYQCQQQNEIQRAYFEHKSFSLFTARAYFRSIDDNEVKSLPITVTTETSGKSRVASLSDISRIISYVESLIGSMSKMSYVEMFIYLVMECHILSDEILLKICVSLFDQNPIGKEYHMVLQ